MRENWIDDDARRHTRARTTRHAALDTLEHTFSTHRLITRTHVHLGRYARTSERERERDPATGGKATKK